MKFKVGDIVRGTINNKYDITNEDMTKGKVVAVGSYEEDDDIIVKVLEHKTIPEWIGHTFPVNSNFLNFMTTPKLSSLQTEIKALARLYENNEVIRTAEAKCSPEDTFDFETGAKLAFERLIERLIEKKKEFVPHLIGKATGKFYGKIGTPTKMKDIAGQPLFVGDVVELIENGKSVHGHKYIVEYYDKHFVMGIINDCDDNGKISDRWVVIKRKGYEELENGEEYTCVKAILEESKQSSEVIL